MLFFDLYHDDTRHLEQSEAKRLISRGMSIFDAVVADLGLRSNIQRSKIILEAFWEIALKDIFIARTCHAWK